MDDLAFDRLTRFVGRFTSRRGALRGLVGAAATAALADPRFKTKAKKKKKKKKATCKQPNTKCGTTGCCKPGQACRNDACQGPCIFTEIPGRWTLQRDCIAQSPITIPSGTTLDGDGHTIFLLGSTQILTYGVGAAGGNVDIENLTVDGSGVTDGCGLVRGIGIRFANASGSVKNSKLIGFAPSCGDAIQVLASGDAAPHTVDIDTVEITDSLVGINVSTPGKVTLGVSNCDIQNVDFGIQVQYNVDATIENNEIDARKIDNNTITPGKYGVFVLALPNSSIAPTVTATGNTITGAQIGMSVAAADQNPGTGIPTLVAIGNTIEGPGPIDQGATHGLQFGKQAAGSASGNTISNFSNSGSSVGCGIFVASNAGVVDVDPGGNTFPEMQGTTFGNEQNECGFS